MMRKVLFLFPIGAIAALAGCGDDYEREKPGIGEYESPEEVQRQQMENEADPSEAEPIGPVED